MMIYGYHPFQDEFGCVTPDSILNTPLQFSRKIKISEEWIELLKGLLEKDAWKRLTIFGIFNHKWLDLPNSRLEHESLKLIDIIKAPKDHSFHQKIATLNSSCTADDMFFNQSLIDPPETIVENKLKQFSNQRKIGKRRQFRKTSRKLNNSFCDNVVTVFLSNKGSKRRGSDVFNSIFLMKPKKLKFSSQFVPSTSKQLSLSFTYFIKFLCFQLKFRKWVIHLTLICKFLSLTVNIRLKFWVIQFMNFFRKSKRNCKQRWYQPDF